MSLRVCEETGDRSGYDRDDFGSAYSSKEDEIVAGLPQIDGQVYTPYTCTLFDIEPDGTAATDIEHIIALAEAYDSGLPEAEYRTFAGDLDNLTIAAPSVWRQVLLPLNVNYSCRFGRLLVRRRTVRWALLRVLKTQKTKRRERPLGDVHGVR